MRVLISTASRHGATSEIGQALAAGLRARAIDADARPIEELEDLAGYDAAVLGSAIYMGRWLKPARQFVERNSAALADMPVWLFSSGPLGPADHLVPAQEPADAAEMVRLSGAREHRVFAGRLDRHLLGLGERAAVRAVHAPEEDSRDWSAVEEFAGVIAAALG